MLDTETALSDDARWAAVVARDIAADGSFVMGVKTTGIYCRPTCPARRPKRENVAFYPDPAAARAAGFRACKRCEPDAEPERRLMAQAVTAAARLIEAAVADEAPAPTLDALAARAGYAPHHFHRMFKRATGVTPRAYASALRAKRADAGLAAGDSVTEAIHGLVPLDERDHPQEDDIAATVAQGLGLQADAAEKKRLPLLGGEQRARS